ncbi:DUF4240 domain-containing protein [Siminovitchia sp. 179-K 8D1 HS]|uniref:DUF4240 domain-containing protein n=1 Tax=Siminovitchia sp. 179-K 8D1 HS TaxID=3142385 RepID=UPI0039A1114A
MKSGDIYAYKTPNGFYSTIRVLKVDPAGEYKLFFFLTSYYDSEIPELDDERLYVPYDDYSISWVEKIDVEGLIHIGHKPLNEWESTRHLKTNIGFDGSLFVLINVPYYRWLEKHDPKAFEQMLEEDRKEEEQRNKEERSLPNKAFWEVIHLIQLDADDPLKEARTKLASFSEKRIKQFEEALARKLYMLDTEKHAREIGEQAYIGDNDYFSPDHFLYVRCLCVAKGQTFYEKVLKQPSLMPKDEGFEELLSLASDAYAEKTGEEFDYIPSKDYETFSNEKGWK